MNWAASPLRAEKCSEEVYTMEGFYRQEGGAKVYWQEKRLGVVYC